MLLTDYFRSTPDLTWQLGRQCGVENGVIRLPEEADFDPAERSHWQTVHKRFTDYGIRPVVVEPLPNCLHDHIKAGDGQRDACIEKAVKMFPIMAELGIHTLCFNFMAHVGWTRTSSALRERGGALVTGFDLEEYVPGTASVSREALWENYRVFLQAAVPEAERWDIRLALHPDDPPVPELGGVGRILTSGENVRRAVYDIVPSPNLGVTMCQATFHLMGEDLEELIPRMAEKIFFVHFRNVTGCKTRFRETFHDNGELDMPGLMRLYRRCGVDVPVRVDHVPTMAGETVQNAGYDALGRLFAIGYLKGILETLERES